MPKKSRKCLPGPPAPEPRKVSKKSQEQSEKTLSTLSGDSPVTSQTIAETFSRLFGEPGPEAPGDIYETFSVISGPSGPRDLCKGRAGSQPLAL